MSFELDILVFQQKRRSEIPSELPFQILTESKKRLSTSISWPFMSRIKGIWYTVGLDQDGFYSALPIIDTDFDTKVNAEFLPYWVMEDEVKSNLTRLSINSKYFNDFSKLIDFLIEESPEKTILFRTRYQGGDRETICGVLSLEEFWKLYSQSRLLFNTCYIVRKE